MFESAKDQELYLALVRAYNEYLAEEYMAVTADRLFPVGTIPTTWLGCSAGTEALRSRSTEFQVATGYQLFEGEEFTVIEGEPLGWHKGKPSLVTAEDLAPPREQRQSRHDTPFGGRLAWDEEAWGYMKEEKAP